MIRDRLKAVARKAAIRLLHMEQEAVEVEKNVPRPSEPAPRVDTSKVPRVQEDDDTPGPNHKTDIGRTFAAAQATDAELAVFLDVRSPEEYAGGVLPRALLLPATSVRRHTDLLPEDREVRIVVYDQDGSGESAEVAAWLREHGWPWARRLVGGFAEWLEHDEPRDPPPGGGPGEPGARARLADGREGWVIGREGHRLRVWLGGEETAEVPAAEVRAPA